MSTPPYLVFTFSNVQTFSVELASGKQSDLQFGIVSTTGPNVPPFQLTGTDNNPLSLSSLSITTEEISLTLTSPAVEAELQIWLSGSVEAGENAYIKADFTGSDPQVVVSLGGANAQPLANNVSFEIS
ncbi:MAG TPA: hypothetical protein VN158_12490 [Caulobacter sp.]|nr:hypothetical protein [Caulobacter sp.]